MHPPAWLMRGVVNPIVRFVARTPLGRRLPTLVVVEFVGRRTGRAYAVPAVAHEVDGSILVFTDAGWAANFRGGVAVTIRRAGSTFAATASVIEDSAEAAACIRAALTTRKPRELGLAVDDGYHPTDDDLNAARRVVRLDRGA